MYTSICIVWLFAGTTAPWKLARAARRDTGGTRSPSGWGRSQVRGKKPRKLRDQPRLSLHLNCKSFFCSSVLDHGPTTKAGRRASFREWRVEEKIATFHSNCANVSFTVLILKNRPQDFPTKVYSDAAQTVLFVEMPKVCSDLWDIIRRQWGVLIGYLGKSCVFPHRPRKVISPNPNPGTKLVWKLQRPR